jgi:uncharacterized protein (TIGR03086 family)
MDTPPAALVGGVAVLERAVAYLLGCLVRVSPEALDRPTPCRHWDVYDLLGHLDDSMAALAEAVEVGRVDRLAPAPLTGDVIGGVRDRASRLLGGWTNAGGSAAVRVAGAPITMPVVAGVGAIEITVHGWDVAAACGRPPVIPGELADELLDLAALLVRAWDRPARFAPPVRVSPGAEPGERLLAFLGRALN